jgi:hypothetical protein
LEAYKTVDMSKFMTTRELIDEHLDGAVRLVPRNEVRKLVAAEIEHWKKNSQCPYPSVIQLRAMELLDRINAMPFVAVKERKEEPTAETTPRGEDRLIEATHTAIMNLINAGPAKRLDARNNAIAYIRDLYVELERANPNT